MGGTCEARPPPPRLPTPKHRPSVKTERFQRAVSAEPKGTPSGAPLRGSTDTSRLSAGGPGAGAPHGNLAGPRQPLVPFPCGKGTRASVDARNSLKQHPEPRPCAPHPRSQHRITKVLRQYRTNELVRRRMNFSSDAMADFEGLLEVNRKICKQQMAEKASPTLPTNCAVLPQFFCADQRCRSSFSSSTTPPYITMDSSDSTTTPTQTSFRSKVVPA